MTAARLREVGSVTSEAIERLHKQLENMPSGEKETDDPEGLLVSYLVLVFPNVLSNTTSFIHMP